MMQFYMAPMEGLTGYVYRNAYEKHFGGIDKYFTPFITNKKLNHKEINDVLPEHNQGMRVVPQILTNRSEDFVCIAKELASYGYEEVNLNLGCPSGTVVAKNRGSGFLALPGELDVFLEEIFAECPLKISIKTRVGKENGEEWARLLSIYEKYPLTELIVHPRVQKDFYKNTPRLETFWYAMEHSRHSLCYNGDIHSRADYERFCGWLQGNACAQEPAEMVESMGVPGRKTTAENACAQESKKSLEKIMLGRGILMNPGLVAELRASMQEEVVQERKMLTADTNCNCAQEARAASRPNPSESGRPCTKETLRAFHDDILSGYQAVMSGDKNTLFKMKELWFYLGTNFTAPEKYLKKIKKSERIAEYEAVVHALFREQELKKGE